MDYWKEAVECALEDAGIVATEQQIKSVTETIEGSFENYGMAYPTPSNPLIGELKETQKALEEERSKSFCTTCQSTGRITNSWGSSGRSTNSNCMECNGKGYI